ncbi:MAG: replicative DNA helicase [Clostridia bacterium]|nr:replicative DNA helicase [Clostridia bacterium]
MSYVERELPYNREAETGVIGCVLVNEKSVASSAEIIKPDDFYFGANREIYAVVMSLFNENIPIDIVTVSDRLAQQDKLDAVGGVAYLTAAATSVATTENVVYHSKIIKEKSVLRRLIKTASAISELAYDGEGEIERILERSEQMIFDVSATREQSDIVPVSDVLMQTYQHMVENSQREGNLTGEQTGFDQLDKATGGLHGGELILIAGRPAMGKSSLAVNIAEYMSIQNGKTVAIFNLEMPKEQLVRRILCSQSMVDSKKMLAGDFTGDDWQRICRVLDKVDAAPLYIDDSASVTVSEIRAKCRRLKQTKGLSLIVIDYLQLMQSGSRTESRQQEVAEISRSLKILAKELDVPVIALSQLSRAVETRKDRRPMLSDIRESGSIEQDCDIVMFIYRDEYYNPDSEDKNIAECIIAKHRNGEPGTIKLGWQGQYTKFTNIEYRQDEEQ